MVAHDLPVPPRREPGVAAPRPEPSPSMPPLRHQHRERDFGIGYGNSSGYGCEEHFVRPRQGPDRFRCV